MKKIAIAGALLALTGCVQVDNYNDVIKHPVPANLADTGSRKGLRAVWSALKQLPRWW